MRSSNRSPAPPRPFVPTGSLPQEPPTPDQTVWAAARSPIDPSEHDIERAEYRRDVGQQMAPADEIHGLQMRTTRRAELAFARSVAAVGDAIDAAVALLRLER